MSQNYFHSQPQENFSQPDVEFCELSTDDNNSNFRDPEDETTFFYNNNTGRPTVVEGYHCTGRQHMILDEVHYHDCTTTTNMVPCETMVPSHQRYVNQQQDQGKFSENRKFS